ncbi:MAG: ammonium transporter [Cytophagales bacterium]|nr:ammonium transporter [Cytophagales bacterium]MDW8384532.1 ammonium transporter [Flammeovirgaceae bacterium]
MNLRTQSTIILFISLSLMSFHLFGQEYVDVASIKNNLEDTTLNLNRLWVTIAAAMVFFMQAGFKALEVGLARPMHTTAIGLKNVVDWLIVSLVFFSVGFGSMFGHSASGFIGTDLFFLNGIEDGNKLGTVFFLFQLAFAGTSVTIVSGAMAERTGFIAYVTLSLFVALLIYPVIGHWCWGNLFFENNPAWLADMGFIDFAGSTVVHSVGAWTALVGVWVVGPRIGRYNAKGTLQPMGGSNLAYSVLGVFILWFGWWGFNGGSLLEINDKVGEVILNTNIAASVSGITSFYHSYLFQKSRDIYEKLLGGIVGGLVAITACCHLVTPLSSLVIGLGAGIIHNLSFDLIIKKLRLDDPVGAIPVHGFCGVWGTLCVGFFGEASRFPEGWDRVSQIGIQALGIVVTFVFVITVSYIIMMILKSTVGLRISPMEEKTGMYFAIAPEEEGQEEIDAETLMKFMEGIEEENPQENIDTNLSEQEQKKQI